MAEHARGHDAATAAGLRAILARQRAAFRADGWPELPVRLDRLKRLARLLVRNEQALVEAIAVDFGGRSRFSTRTGDIVGGVAAVRHHLEHLAEWMRPVPVPMPPAMEAAGARAEVRREPLGVVGAIVPWNGPVLMGVLAAAGVLAAGNRLMLKVPEMTPGTSALLARLFAEHFDETEARVVEGGPEVGAAFSALPFDHLLFTGSAAVARQVMRAAAEHLVPVTLELGGKNPVIVGRSAGRESAAARIVTGKMASAGQVCVSPDDVYVPAGTGAAWIDAMAAQAARLYPRLADNDDYTAIANDRHFARLVALLDDARRKGARVTEVNPAAEPLWQGGARKFPLCLLDGVTDDMLVAHEETFGPILAVREYERVDDALAAIAARPNPLSAYYFGDDPDEERAVVQGIAAGNLVVNDVRCQLFFEQLPFGGVGGSGMGRYRGRAGFETFSNAKTVVYQMRADAPLAAQRPPFGDAAKDALARQVEALRREFDFDPPSTEQEPAE